MGADKITRKASMSLAGKKIVITGAAGGLGAGVAKVAFDQGAEPVLLGVVDNNVDIPPFIDK